MWLIATAWGGIIAAWLAGGLAHSVTLQVLGILGGLSWLLGVLAWASGRGAQFVLLATSILVGLGGSEMALRWALPSEDYEMARRQLYMPDAGLGWRFRPSAEVVLAEPAGEFRSTVQISTNGFRDREDSPGDEDRRRMVVLGDSFVANIAVDLDKVFVRVLEERWQGRVGVRNRGVTGYGQVQQLRLLEEVLNDLRPSVVLLMVFPLNDLADNLGELDWQHGYDRPWASMVEGELRIEDAGARAASPPRSAIVEGLKRLRLYQLARGAVLEHWFPQGVPGYRGAPELIYFQRDSQQATDRGFAVFELLLAEINERCRQHDARLGVVLAPCDWQVDEQRWETMIDAWGLDANSYDRWLPNERIEAICRRMDVAYFDLTPRLAEEAERGTPLYFQRDRHWNENANAVVADALYDWIEQEGMSVEE